jgi:hypothetical protein
MTQLSLALLLACGGTEAPHGHDHDGDHAHHDDGGHAHEEGHGHDHHEEAHHDAPATTGGAIEGPLGAYTARLEPGGDTLRLVVLDAEGKEIPAAGKAKVLLTGTGEEAQKVVLTASGEAWTGAAKVGSAPGYLAVVSVTVDGHQESARLTGGDVREQKPAPEPHDHGDHAHDHGEGSHGHPH